MPSQLAFPAKADMRCVSALREEWLAKIENETHAHIDCAKVEVITAAAAQLVVALAKGLHAAHGSVCLTRVPDALREDFILLGLTEFLQEPSRHV